MLHFTLDQILELENIYRRNLINSLYGCKPAVLIGTSNSEGQNNLAIFSQVFHIGATPPLLGVLFRPDSVERHTLSNIREMQHFTINHVGVDMAAQAHQTSARYAKDISEFDATGIEAEQMEGIEAPFVKKSPLKMHCKAVEEIKLQVNSTILLIATIQDVFVDELMLGADGFINPQAGGLSAVAGLDAYFSMQAIGRYAYAKPDKPAKEIHP